jgi:glycosyltransferase involved in cell wall biosynthesis
LNYNFFSPYCFEKWDFRSPENPGIGGSETAVVELARRLAIRGHAVNVYAPIPDDCPRLDQGGARWFTIEEADFTQRGFWAIFRSPPAIDNFPVDHPYQKLWMICQDVAYLPDQPAGLTRERAAKIDLLFALCTEQGLLFHKHWPECTGRIAISSNGIKTDQIARMTQESQIERDPFKVIYSSSPDRGFLTLLKIIKRAREFEPRLNLAACYGWDNIEKIEIVKNVRLRKECDILMDEMGFKYLGRLGQTALWHQYLSAGIWCYPTHFTETSCICCMEAQALGAIPITNPLWALAENVRYGTFIQGDPEKDPFARSRYVGELVELARDHDRQEQIRPQMMEYARKRFDWEEIVTQYEAFAQQGWGGQYDFQIRNGNGRVLNLGCNNDAGRQHRRGAVNVDCRAFDPRGHKNAADLIADCREPLPFPPRSFDTVIFGDILEHMVDDDIHRALVSVKPLLDEGGKIIVTIPEDPRGKPADSVEDEYTDGVYSYHWRCTTRPMAEAWFSRAGFKIARYECYTVDCDSSGVIIPGHAFLLAVENGKGQ